VLANIETKVLEIFVDVAGNSNTIRMKHGQATTGVAKKVNF
jgi:hypothetical protein